MSSLHIRRATLQMVPSDVLYRIMDFVGPGHFCFVAGTCQSFYHAYTRQFPNDFKTSQESVVGSAQTAEIYLLSKNKLLPQSRALKLMPPLQSNLQTFHVACWAARYGRADTLQWVIQQHDDDDMSSFLDWQYNMFFVHAARNGHIDVLQYLHQVAKRSWPVDICRSAARSNAAGLDCLVYVTTHGAKLLPPALSDAAMSGNVDCLGYILKRYNDDCAVAAAGQRGEAQKSHFVNSALKKAAAHGQTNCLAFLLQLEDVDWSHRALQTALVTSATNNNLDSVKCLIEHDRGHEWSYSDLWRSLVASASGDALDCLDYLLNVRLADPAEQPDDGFNWISNRAMYRAAKKAIECDSVRCLGRLLQVNDVHEWGIHEDELLSGLLAEAERYRKWGCVHLLRTALAN